ncbi:uroporphyrinogen-III synthase-like [Diorhabda sublineata]|uniref:uroporphyrinogen-III synthase-like n=1 Tax=Diorhabda sublineata TaxID=1163346 RepID=UPI0024E182A5|nr:uroporphyrinogen-III synthase-like [Diorhabda sublineata]
MSPKYLEVNTVLLLKTQIKEQSVDKYEQLLVANGFAVKQVNTLVFQYKNLELLTKKLNCSDCYSGIIFSSPRCVQAVYLAYQNSQADISSWKLKKNFAVGAATSKEALEKLGLECKGQESGSAENLLNFILKENCSYKMPFLYPHGNLKRDTFSELKGTNEITVESVLAYDTINNPNILDEMREATDNFTLIPEYVIFFSPSGVHSTLEYLRKVENFTSSKLIPIGPTTELSMKEANLPVFGVAQHPSPQGVLDIILSKSISY